MAGFRFLIDSSSNGHREVTPWTSTTSVEESLGITPNTVMEARRLPEKEKREEAMKEELATLEKMGIWEKVPISKKARLVARAFNQIPGVHCFETYLPVAKLVSIRAILGLAAELDLEIHQVNVVSAYLNGKFTGGEEVYMSKSSGFGEEKGDGGGWVLRLKKPLYGLKQSGTAWYKEFFRIMTKELEFLRSDVDHGSFTSSPKLPVLVMSISHPSLCLQSMSTTILLSLSTTTKSPSSTRVSASM